jgi:hypothetical protein
MMAQNQLSNPGFEMTSAGSNPPYDPPDDWASFGVQVNPYAEVGFNNYATQAHNDPIYNPSNPGDQSNLFPGYDDSRALKIWGRGLDAGGGNFSHSLGTIYQQWMNSMVPAGSTLTLTGRAYVSSVDPLGANNNIYLVIKCFPSDFSQELCGTGGTKSTAITSATQTDTWAQYSATVASLPANATVVQAGIEFEQCASGACNTQGGSVFWDDIYFAWE